jgi:hypothetical protein
MPEQRIERGQVSRSCIEHPRDKSPNIKPLKIRGVLTPPSTAEEWEIRAGKFSCKDFSAMKNSMSREGGAATGG